MKLVSYYLMASSYRKNIYMKTDSILNSDFIIGEKVGDVKEMDISLLKNRVFQPKRIEIRRNVCYDKGVISFFKKNRYDTLITGGDAYNITVWLLLLYCKLKGIKVIMWTHGFYGRESKSRILIKKFFFSFADRLWVYGNYAKRLLSQNNIFPKEKIDIVYNSLDYETQLALRAQMKSTGVYKNHFKNDAPVLLFLGRLTFSKKLDMIFDAVRLLEGRGQRYNIVLVGDGEAKETLLQKVGSLNVWFYGRCFAEDTLAELVYNADVCVSPGFVGLTAMHAMMFGCPVITHNDFPHQAPEFEAINEGVTGAFFKENDVVSLADSIDSWFELHKEKRDKVRFSCYEEIDNKWNPNVQIQIMKESLELLRKV